MKTLKKIYQFVFWLSIGYLSLPCAAFSAALLLCFIFWIPVPINSFFHLLNPANGIVMRTLLIISIIFASIMTAKHDSIKDAFK